MTGPEEPEPDHRERSPRLSWDPFKPADNWMQRRRDKIYEEIQRNRRGEYVVPTWVLTVALVAIIAAFAAVIAFA